MALKAVHLSNVPNLHHVSDNATSVLCSGRFAKGVETVRRSLVKSNLLVIGHRGSGMNALLSQDPRMKAIKENTLLSFNNAAKSNVDFVEFDVQVTKDDCPVIFHDDFILTKENGNICERRLTELTLSEFLCYGPQRVARKTGKSLLRKTKDGRSLDWNVEQDDCFCTLQEAFEKVDTSVGFNIELKFDDHIVYKKEDLTHILQVILGVVYGYAKERPIIFSSFQPDAAQLIRKLQSIYPVYFLTNGGNEIFPDVRRNSLDEAIEWCLENGLHGVVSEVRAIFRNPGAIAKIKESNLALLTYGQLNNVPEAVYLQHLMGIDGVIVDLVQEITKAVSDMIKPGKEDESEEVDVVKGQMMVSKPKFSQHELSFLLKLIPELIQH